MTPTHGWTAERRAEIEKLLEKATPGPWKTFGDIENEIPELYVWTEDYETYVASCWVSSSEEHPSAHADAAFIAAARTALPDAMAWGEQEKQRADASEAEVRRLNARWEALKAWNDEQTDYIRESVQAEILRLERPHD